MVILRFRDQAKDDLMLDKTHQDLLIYKDLEGTSPPQFASKSSRRTLLLWEENTVNDVDNTTSNSNIGFDDVGVVDHDFSAHDHDLQ